MVVKFSSLTSLWCTTLQFVLKLLKARPEEKMDVINQKMHIVNPMDIADRVLLVREELAISLATGFDQYVARGNVDVKRKHLQNSSYTSGSSKGNKVRWGSSQQGGNKKNKNE